MEKLTKLDSYQYMILPGIIRISLISTSDPSLVDIMSEIESSDGNIYVEGSYYKFLNNYDIHTKNDESFIDLWVVEIVKQ